MPDYVYLLENRLSADQQHALRVLRDTARDVEMILFLTGDAVRDLTSGHAVRDIEVSVQGNALKFKKKLEKSGAKVWGEDEVARTLYLSFPGTVRVDLTSTHRVDYPKLGHPVYAPANIQEDLRRRDFTVNAMAISLNEGSYGLLMDPLNGAADIETRTLRLVSNYGFIEDPSLLVRATRFRVRLGWELDPRSQQRYENAKAEGALEYLTKQARSRELEQIGHEDDGLKVLHALEDEGWMKALFPQWTHSKADLHKLHALHDLAVQLLMQGVHPDMSAAQMQLLTAKMQPKDLSALKKAMLRPGFVEDWNHLDASAAAFAKVLMGKENKTPSASYRLFTTYDPNAVLWLGFTSKDKAVLAKYEQFLKVWPEVKKQVPFALMLEMRIRPELAGYDALVHAIFLELIDGKLQTPEEMKAYLEPHSPPPPPPPVTIKRTRAKRGVETRVKEFDEDEEAEHAHSDEDLDDMGGEDDIGLGPLKMDHDDEKDGEEDEDEAEEEKPVRVKAGKAAAPVVKPAKGAAVKAVAEPVKKAAEAKPAPKTAAKAKPEPVKKAVVKPAAKAVAKKPAPKPAPKPKKAPVKKAAVKPAAGKAKKAVPVVKAKHKPKPKPHKSAKPASKAAKKPVHKR